jgi:hypothetical protein
MRAKATARPNPNGEIQRMPKKFPRCGLHIVGIKQEKEGGNPWNL